MFNFYFNNFISLQYLYEKKKKAKKKKKRKDKKQRIGSLL